jgi:DNA repair protein RadC
MTALYVREHDAYREANPRDVFAHAQVLMSRQFRPGAPVLERRDQLRAFLQLRLGACEYEVFGVIYLDARRRLIALEELFRGTVSQAQVYTREVLKSVLAHNAIAVMLFHNHPSGDCQPSTADEFFTGRLKNALALIDVDVVDHLIVSAQVFSFAEHGLL